MYIYWVYQHYVSDNDSLVESYMLKLLLVLAENGFGVFFLSSLTGKNIKMIILLYKLIILLTKPYFSLLYAN